MKKLWKAIRSRLFTAQVVSFPIYCLASAIGRSLKIQEVGRAPVDELTCGKIMAGWHGRTFIAATAFRGEGVWTIISRSRDGEIQNRIFARFGFNIIRGSSGREGIRAALESIKALRSGATMAFTPDGPRGPSGVIQEGILMMAQRSGAALVPVGVSARRRWLARSWDRYLIPKPGSEAVMIYGAPIWIPADATPNQVQSLRQHLQDEMHRLEAEAEALMGHSVTA
ncbi:MAG TPA: lysophospholipid acyltransferase family protein [Fimbriimonadaceae bacterium]|nr:lysophospholipid acyltransferase family protein [Fimbriimonadaceae bacterium]HRJ32892.1 lysophospholipid acyltransferase family protein [Fimbriimonadaceae bacterium]